MCILFEICEKRPLQKCLGGGGGGGGHIFQHSATHWTVHRNMALHTVIISLPFWLRQHGNIL